MGKRKRNPSVKTADAAKAKKALKEIVACPNKEKYRCNKKFKRSLTGDLPRTYYNHIKGSPSKCEQSFRERTCTDCKIVFTTQKRLRSHQGVCTKVRFKERKTIKHFCNFKGCSQDHKESRYFWLKRNRLQDADKELVSGEADEILIHYSHFHPDNYSWCHSKKKYVLADKFKLQGRYGTSVHKIPHADGLVYNGHAWQQRFDQGVRDPCPSPSTRQNPKETRKKRFVEFLKSFASAYEGDVKIKKYLSGAADMLENLVEDERYWQNLYDQTRTMADTQSKKKAFYEAEMEKLRKKTEKEKEALKREMKRVENLLAELQTKKMKISFQVLKTKKWKRRVHDFTGLKTVTLVEALYNALTLGGKITLRRPYESQDAVPTEGRRKLKGVNSLFCALFILRTGCTLPVAAGLFGVSESVCSETFVMWIRALAQYKGLVLETPSNEETERLIPPHMKEACGDSNLAWFVDASEIEIQKFSDQWLANTSFSPYKSRNTIKVLGALHVCGCLLFMSEPHPGRICDDDITLASGFLGLLEKGQTVMADKGFALWYILSKLGVDFVAPPKAKIGQAVFTALQTQQTRWVARLRIHVERAFRCLKAYRWLHPPIAVLSLDLVYSAMQAVTFLQATCAPPLTWKKQELKEFMENL